jgi:tRNA-2-methylthio-N6-dimethylallyladenosine synthase
MTKKLFIKTYGCQMNAYDTDRMADVLAPLGYVASDNPENADLIILNTCHIREKAEDKVYSDLGRMRVQKENAKAQGRQALIAVGGCVGQAAGAEIIKRAPYVDMVFGPQSYHRLPQMIAEAKRKSGVVDLDFPAVQKFDSLPDPSVPRAGAAFLSVQEGCDKFCTFCVVPYTRGAEFSRPAKDVLREAKGVIAQGAVEITLLGQNVNAYHGEASDGGADWNLARLIRELAELDGLQRIRYMTSHPRDMDEELIAVHGDVPQLMPFLHLPIQSGSDRILKKMNRKHKAADYLAIVEKLRAKRSDIALSSDFIVGFPDETEEDFADTMRLVETVDFSLAFSFKYSPRPGTPAAESTAQVPEEIKVERLAVLQSLLNRQQHRFNEQSVGKTYPVLFEKQGKREGQLVGKSPYLQSVHVLTTENLIGTIHSVTIKEGHENSLAGELVGGNL